MYFSNLPSGPQYSAHVPGTAGTYPLTLTVGQTYPGPTRCSTTSQADIEVYDMPAPTVITAPSVLSCNPYILELQGSTPLSGHHHLSTGATAPWARPPK